MNLQDFNNAKEQRSFDVIPAGTIATGLRQYRVAASPTAKPARNGQAVCQIPAGLSP